MRTLSAKEYMKKLRSKMIAALVPMALTLMLATMVLAACGSFPGFSNGKDRITKLEDAGSSFGTPPPKWVMVYQTHRTTDSLQDLPEYKGYYCFIADEYENGSTTQVLQQLTRWADQFSAQQKIGQYIRSGTASLFLANEGKAPKTAEAARQSKSALGMINQANFIGAKKQGDWWIKERVEAKGQEPVIRYRVISFYTIPQEQLNKQIESKMDEIVKENPAMSAVVDAVNATVLQKGIDWEPVETEPVSHTPDAAR
jgi:hypothetical protein